MTNSNSATPEDLKAEARTLRQAREAAGSPMTHSQALEAVAHAHGYRDWNAASAALLRDPVCPVALGDKVSGLYLKQPFTGTVRSADISSAGYYRLVLHFDTPVDVVPFDSFSMFRQRVTCRIDTQGRSPEKTSDGHPHMVLTL